MVQLLKFMIFIRELLPAGTDTAKNQTFASFIDPLCNLPVDQKTDLPMGKALARPFPNLIMAIIYNCNQPRLPINCAIQSLHTRNKNVHPETNLRIEWQPQTYQYLGGKTIELRKPMLHLNNLAYGTLHPNTQKSFRSAPPLLGVGLIEQVLQTNTFALQEPSDANQKAISGREKPCFESRKPTVSLFCQ